MIKRPPGLEWGTQEQEEDSLTLWVQANKQKQIDYYDDEWNKQSSRNTTRTNHYYTMIDVRKDIIFCASYEDHNQDKCTDIAAI